MAWFEDLPLDFSRAETQRARRILVSAYPTNAEILTLAEDSGLDLSQLPQAANPGTLVHEILKKARLSDRLLQLLTEVLGDRSKEAVHAELRTLVAGDEAKLAKAALQRKPSLATIAGLPSSMEVWSDREARPQRLATPGLEQMVNAAAGFADVTIFRQRLAEAEVRTGRIEIGGKARGTGFLVGESLLLTNWHVVAAGVEGAVARFDYKVSPAGTMVSEGRTVAFATDWRVAFSPHEAGSIETSADGPLSETWDFALVRLEEPVGAEGIGPQPEAVNADRRGYYRLEGTVYHFETEEPLLIVGHPDGRPMQLSYASPSGAKTTLHHNRLRYRTNTEAGSSGSPVFNRDWRVVALHHAAGPTKIPGEFNLNAANFNQGVPITSIVTELKRQLTGTPAMAELHLT